jgi:hypothetical protein
VPARRLPGAMPGAFFGDFSSLFRVAFHGVLVQLTPGFAHFVANGWFGNRLTGKVRFIDFSRSET